MRQRGVTSNLFDVPSLRRGSRPECRTTSRATWQVRGASHWPVRVIIEPLPAATSLPVDQLEAPRSALYASIFCPASDMPCRSNQLCSGVRFAQRRVVQRKGHAIPLCEDALLRVLSILNSSVQMSFRQAPSYRGVSSSPLSPVSRARDKSVPAERRRIADPALARGREKHCKCSRATHHPRSLLVVRRQPLSSQWRRVTP